MSSEAARLLHVLRLIDTGPKDLFVEPALNRLLDHVISARTLKARPSHPSVD
jgi:hypothetical protein